MAEPLHQSVSDELSLSRYYNASQLRIDTWQRLGDYCAWVAESTGNHPGAAEVSQKVNEALAILEPIAMYWAFPGREALGQVRRLLASADYGALAVLVARIVRALINESYRRRPVDLAAEPPTGMAAEAEDEENDETDAATSGERYARPYFEVLIVDQLATHHERAVRESSRALRRPEDRFIYEPVIVPTFEDALIAVLLNYTIQACVIRYNFPFSSRIHLEPVTRELRQLDSTGLAAVPPARRGMLLARVLGQLRPELDVYLVTDAPVEELAGDLPDNVRRVFYHREGFLELHLNILRAVAARQQTPFFSALTEYSRQPTGVFHALPISRGKSIVKSHWIQDMARFYGMNIFLAETSATSGGLDSLLEPHGPIKRAQELAARAFGARHSYFVTNGTSTTNKIVVQALVKPGDIVLVDRNCHKSQHYALVLAGARVVYLAAYPLQSYSMYGAVPLREIKRTLLALKDAGKLGRVRMLLLTNCTFDGIVYNVERVMEECLAIKPDLVFLWDEAWFAFARSNPTYRQRTGMAAAASLEARFADPDYRRECERVRAALALGDEASWLDARLLPDPERARVRVYVTQSTHKTLTALRQGSMIHVHDQDFGEVEENFHEAYMTHTSTSPNYQILASLDVGRRQLELEGFELVQKQVEMAMTLRQQVLGHPLLHRHFRFLTVKDLIPAGLRATGVERFYDREHGWMPYWESWANDELTLDPTRLTLYVGATGIDGATFRDRYLMEQYGIQVNKTSRNTVLFMTNIGTTRSSVAYLIEVLVNIAKELDAALAAMGPAERRLHARRVRSLTESPPPPPDFSRFHDRFRPDPGGTTPEGDLRAAFFLAYDDDACDYLALDDGSIDRAMEAGREVVSATFVTPYPPGYPALVPGQVVTPEILAFLRALDVKEIHGYRPELGLRVFSEQALESAPGDPIHAA